ncbi:hypothetical protein BS78_04G261000 [Paspalum vaginatum]|nr:hypothetical protein BS78_04G261000 [Paspalum vaginatum]
MGRKAKRCAKKAAGRDDKAAQTRAEGAASSDGGEEGAGAAATATVLPMANLVRLMRQVIPKGVKISTRAKQLTHDCAVEFVGFVAGEASAQAAAQHRRTIAPEDFTCSFRALGFDDYVDPMTTYIHRYREQHHRAAGYAGFVPPGPPPPPPAAAAAVVTAPGAPSCFADDEEMQYLSSMVPPQREEYGEAGSSSAYSPTPAGHGDLLHYAL